MDNSNSKNNKMFFIAVTVIFVVIVFFVFIKPFIKFKSLEKKLLEAGKNYYEINSSKLPIGANIGTVYLQTIYDKKFLTEDLKLSSHSKICDKDKSWVKIQKKDGNYNYYVYLKCGLFSSKVDHTGPVINLKGQENIEVNLGEEYKDPGIASVIDDHDGNIDPKKVTVDSSKVDTETTGTYRVAYKIRDSFGNETIKYRTVVVRQNLNYIIEHNTGSSNRYKGYDESNYILIDGIVFRIIGLNKDGTVKLISADGISYVDYNSIEKWLDEEFYAKLSDSAKKVIVSKKYCNEVVADTNNYTKCKGYTKSRKVYLPSIIDINKSIKDNQSNIAGDSRIWLGNKKGSKKAWSYYFGYEDYDVSDLYSVKPVITIAANLDVKQGDGTETDPYVLKDNYTKLKVGSKVSDAVTGSYISYSGYLWRVINSEADGTTKVILDDTLSSSEAMYYETIGYSKTDKFDPTYKENIIYKVNSTGKKYIKTNYLVNEETPYNTYDKKLSYKDRTIEKYKVKMSIPSVYDLYSATLNESFWFYDSFNGYDCYSEYGFVKCDKEAVSKLAKVRITGYLSSKLKIKGGSGIVVDPYLIVK